MKDLLRTVCFIGLAALLFVHFTMTLAATLPPTPLSVQYSRAIDPWIFPYFVQNWSFFAPDPPTDDAYVMAQYRYQSKDSKVQESAWVNLSWIFNETVQQNRLSPLEIVQLTILNASTDVVQSEAFHNGQLDTERLNRLIASNRQPPSLHALERLAMAGYRAAGIPGEPIAVRVSLLHHNFPRFTHRQEHDNQASENTQLLFPFVPFERVASL
jgi:hypothetical protein